MKNLHFVFTLIFGLAVFLFFGLAYPHHLHYQEQYQLFLFDSTYVWDIIKLPGGFADLLGRFCTQFFLFSWIGSLIIGILLASIQLLTLRTVSWGRLYGLSFVPAFLLWYFLLDENALLGGIWAVLLTLLTSCIFDKFHDGLVRRVLLIVFIPILYWISGPVSILLLLLQAPNPKKTVKYYGVFAIFAALLVVLSLFIPVAPKSLWYGIHYYRYPATFPTLLWVAVLSVFILVLFTRCLLNWANASSRYIIHILSFVLIFLGMGFFLWKTSNFKAEKAMQYDFMASHQQWNRIIETINTEKPNNQIGVTVQNLALAMRGMLPDYMFQFNQNGMAGLLPDVQSDATSPIPTAEALYQLGMITVAQRTVFEAQEAIMDFQKSARCYKRLAETNLILGSYKVSRKYLMTLQKTMFYSDWANETLQLLDNEKALAKHPEYGRLRKMAYAKDFYFSDRVTPQMLEDLFLHNKSNRLAYDYLMASYLLTGDLENFANSVGWGEKLGYKTIPRHFQEALVLYWSLNHESNKMMSAQINPEVAQHFRQFVQFLNSPMASQEGLRQNYGGTYWYYYSTIKQ